MNDALVSKLYADLEDAHALITSLKEQLGMTSFSTLPVFKFTRSEEIVFNILMMRDRCQKSTIMIALYGGIDKDEPNEAIIGVLIHHIRAKLRPYGFQILIKGWGEGWYIDSHTKQQINAMIANTRV